MSTKPLILPIVWNVTGRTVVFWAAKATVFSPANADLDIDVVVGSSVTGPNFDAGAHTSVLTAGKLTIPSGQYFSTTTVEAGFNASQPVESYMMANFGSWLVFNGETAPPLTKVALRDELENLVRRLGVEWDHYHKVFRKGQLR